MPYIPQKKAFFSSNSNFDLFEKNWKKKSNFSNFFVKIDADHLSLPAHFSNLCLKISKLSLSALWKGFEIEINQRRTHYN